MHQTRIRWGYYYTFGVANTPDLGTNVDLKGIPECVRQKVRDLERDRAERIASDEPTFVVLISACPFGGQIRE